MEKTLLLKYTYFQKAVRWLCVDARLVFGKLVEIPQFGLVTEETHRSIDGIYSLFGNVRQKPSSASSMCISATASASILKTWCVFSSVLLFITSKHPNGSFWTDCVTHVGKMSLSLISLVWEFHVDGGST